MHALNLDKGRDELVALVATARVVAVDHRIGMLIRPPFFVKDREIVEGLLRLRQIVDRLAGLLTLAATYAAGEIDQTCKRVRRCPRLPCPGRLNGCGNTRPCSPRHGKKTPSAEFHVHSLLVMKIVSQSYQELCQRILSRTPRLAVLLQKTFCSRSCTNNPAFCILNGIDLNNCHEGFTGGAIIAPSWTHLITNHNYWFIRHKFYGFAGPYES